MKYYTPSVEEFHVGFEYERFEPVLIDKGCLRVHQSQWVSKIADEKYIMTYYGGWEFVRDLEDKLVRVKSLDIKDVESFGFLHLKSSSCGDESFQMLLDDSEDFWEIDMNENGKLLIEFYKSTGFCLSSCITKFEGYIKNKSELSVLMKQLRII
jgi:hypothetical protein